MSASLVGSEMCIRDSLLRWPSACSSGVIPMSRTFSFSWARSPAPEDLGAVSYTHLTLPTICSV
eukprot:3408440-Alexandrium_andersonii.AAC.1